MEREIKVFKAYEENDDYVELWKTFDEEKPIYYGRYTWNDLGIWYHVADPLGYCELDSQVADDVMFICCDAEGNEQCRYSNADPNPLVKFETYIKAQWDKYKDNLPVNEENYEKNFWSMWWDGTTTYKVNQWLLSFKDPEIYGDIARDYDENWYGCWHEKQIAWEPIKGTEFTYLGNKYQFVKVIHKHDVCGVKWDEFVCADSPLVITDNWWEPIDDSSEVERPWIRSYMYLGNWFDDSKYGTMLDRASAIKRVKNAIADIYKGELISKIQTSYGYTFERLYTYSDAAEHLIGRNYNIEHISEVIRVEAENPSFEVVSDPTIEERYPGVARDHKYNYSFGTKWTA